MIFYFTFLSLCVVSTGLENYNLSCLYLNDSYCLRVKGKTRLLPCLPVGRFLTGVVGPFPSPLLCVGEGVTHTEGP